MHEHIADDLEIVEFARLKKVQGEPIETISKETKINLVNLMFHAKRCYGKLFSTMKKKKQSIMKTTMV